MFMLSQKVTCNRITSISFPRENINLHLKVGKSKGVYSGWSIENWVSWKKKNPQNPHFRLSWTSVIAVKVLKPLTYCPPSCSIMFPSALIQLSYTGLPATHGNVRTHFLFQSQWIMFIKDMQESSLKWSKNEKRHTKWFLCFCLLVALHTVYI